MPRYGDGDGDSGSSTADDDEGFPEVLGDRGFLYGFIFIVVILLIMMFTASVAAADGSKIESKAVLGAAVVSTIVILALFAKMVLPSDVGLHKSETEYGHEH